MDMTDLRDQFANNYVDVIALIPAEKMPSTIKLCRDAFNAGFDLLREQYVDLRLTEDMFVDFLNKHDLKGEFEEYINESKLSNWESIIEKYRK